MRIYFLAALSSLLLVACMGPSSGLGYRAREAAIAGNIEEFEELMKEAVEDGPQFPGDKPVTTVLTHFLDFAGHPRFLEVHAEWVKKGWVKSDMDCAVWRARHNAVYEKDPAEAKRMADKCINRAREAAQTTDRRWEIEACLSETKFLLETSTVALSPFIELANDPTQPEDLRVALLDGMTHVYLVDPNTRRENEPELSEAKALAMSTKEAEANDARFMSILNAVRSNVDSEVLARSTAFGAMEIERVSQKCHRSFLGRFARSKDPFEADLAWFWTQDMKGRDKIHRLAGLGLWNRRKEPEKDAFWYVCSGPSGKEGIINGYTVRLNEPAEDVNALREAHCKPTPAGEALPWIDGPYPLESTSRSECVLARQEALKKKVKLVIVGRRTPKLRRGS